MRCGALRGLVEQFGDVREALAQAGHGPARQVRVGEHGTDPQRLGARVLGTTEEVLEVPGERGETPTDPQFDVSDVELTIGGAPVAARAGDLVRMPADIPHAVRALTAFKMLLVMLKEPR